MEKVVNIISVEYGTITVDVSEGATSSEIEALAMDAFNEGQTSWGNQESYFEVDSEKLPQLFFEESSIYQLFDCDEWRSNDSMVASSPIAVSIDKYQFAKMLALDLEEEAAKLSEDNKELFDAIDKEEYGYELQILAAYLDQRVDYRHVIELAAGYKTN